MIFDFELEGKNTIKGCEKCEYGLIKQYKTVVDKNTVTTIGVCDECKTIYQSSDALHSYKNIQFIGG